MPAGGRFEDMLPLSPLQEGMLFHALFDEEAPDVYTVRLAMDVEGDFDPALFRAAVRALLARHTNLRAGFRTAGLERPVQLIPRAIDVPVTEIDLSGLDEHELASRLAELTEGEAEIRFDLMRPPLLRFTVLTVAERRHRILFTCHHILLDGWSMPVLLGELFQLYQRGGDAAALSPVTPFREFLAWLRRQDRPAALAAWRNRLAGLPGATRLVERAGEPARELPGEVRAELSETRTQDLAALTRRLGITTNTVVQCAWALLLGGQTAGRDVVFGTTVSGRPPEVPGIESMIGLFINTLPVRVRLDPAQPVGELLRRMHTDALDVLPHQHLGLTDIQRAAGHSGELFDSLVVFENYPLDTAALEDAATGLRISAVEAGDATHYPVLLNAGGGDRLWLKLSYRRDLLDESAAQLLLERFTRLLTAVVEEPRCLVGTLNGLLATEVHAEVVGRNQTELAGSGRTVVRRFEDQVARTPEALAVTAEHGTLTYAELEASANRLARLLAERGIGPGDLVALATGSTPEAITAMLAVLKCGAAYLPVDPEYPAERVAFLLSDARPALVVADRVGAAALPTDADVLRLDAETTRQRLAALGAVPLRRELSPFAAAYVIYTSGSTGTPKGVVIEHRSLTDYLEWTARYPGAAGVALLHSPLAFDLTVTALYTPLLTGGRVCLTDLKSATGEVPAMLADAPCTFLKATPSHLGLLEALPPEYSPSAELLLGGEALLGEQLAHWREQHPGALVRNVYGPTEATVNCAEYTLEPGTETPKGPVPIGRPHGNARLYVLDWAGRPVPQGVTGELYLAGEGLARGYLGRPALTAERFVADPFGPPGSRMYRSGDLACWDADGNLVFRGRADDQVKVRGHRVEPAEIEAALLAEPGVTEAAVVLREDREGDQRLVGYVTGHAVPDELREALAGRLPAPMVPSAVVALEALPLTPNGKLDRPALPAPEHAGGGGGRQPRTPQEQILCGLFAEVLGVGAVTVDDDFFDLGGHSLLATRLAGRIRSTLGVELSIRALFEQPTVAELARHTGDAPVRPALRPRKRPESIPLSAAQRRLWFLNRFEGPSATYNVPIAVRLTGPLDREALRAAVGDVLSRHESLRTTFPARDGEPCQEVLPAAAVEPDFVVVESAAPEALVEAESQRGFDLAAAPPVRVRLYVLGGDEHVLLVVLHHIVSDASSRAPFARDLGVAYRARRAGHAPDWTPLPVQYADYTLWQHDALGTEGEADSVLAGQAEFWLRQLAGSPPELTLPTDRPRPAVASHRGETLTVDVDARLHRELLALGRTTQASLFMVLQSGIAVLLNTLGAGDDLPLGTPIAGRTDDALDDLVGFFVNTLVLRTDTSGDPTFRELISRVRETDLAAYANQDLPFERLVELANPGRSLARHPMFQVMLTLQNVATPELGVPGLAVSEYRTHLPIAKFDLLFGFVERYTEEGTPAGIGTAVEFSTDLFDRSTVEWLADRLVRLLGMLVADPKRRLSRIDPLNRSEHRQLARWNDTVSPAQPEPLLDRFAAQVVRSPEAPAVRSEGITLTYAEVDRLSNQLAHWLIARNAGPERVVALAIPRSPHFVVAVVATLKTGAAYLPVDPEYPAERIAFMLAEAEPAVVLSMASVADALPVPASSLDEAGFVTELTTFPDTAVTSVPRHPLNPAYVMFTSGSTGRPKGVMLPSAALANLLAWHATAVATPPGSRVAQFTATSFDVSAQEILSSLTGGHCLLVVPEAIRRDPPALVDWLAEQEIAELYAPTLVIHAVCEAAEASGTALPALTDIAQAGEALVPSNDLRAFARRHPGLRLHNHYGPTETHVVTGSTLPTEVERWPGVPPIGKPIHNTRLHILDRFLRPTAPGVAGELYLAGAGLARGYFRQPSLTAERFVADPFSDVGARLYRTGDLARWNTDGTVSYLGRLDDQVKIRGFRVELGEVESALREDPAVGAAAAVVRETARGEYQLVAHIVPAEESEPDPSVLRSRVARRLPAHLVPAVVGLVEELPTLPNGKLDRRALAARDVGEGQPGREPSTPVEHAMCRVFAEVLGLETVSVDDDFFALGGHSLAATRLVGGIRDVFGVELAIRTVFAGPTPADLVVALGEQGTAGRGRRKLEPMARPEHLPLSYAQQRLWFLNRLEGRTDAYNLPFVIRLTDGFDAGAFQTALTDLVTRHEVLRTTYPDGDSGPRQHILPPAAGTPEVVLTPVAEEALTEAVNAAVGEGFDLTTELPLRVRVFEVGRRHHVLVLVLHHIAADGWSLRPFGRDLVEAYEARRAGHAPDQQPLPVQYADYTLWQYAELGDEDDPASRINHCLDYWRHTLAALPAELALPADHDRPRYPGYRAERVHLEVPSEVHSRLTALARETGTSMFMVVQAACAVLLRAYGAGEDIPLGSPIAGRTDPALDELVGMFVNTLVLRTDLAGEPTVRELLNRVRDRDLAAYEHQDLPFERLVEELNPARSLARQPLYQVMLTFLDMLPENTAPEAPSGMAAGPLPTADAGAKCDLSFNVGERFTSDGLPDGLTGTLEYSLDLFQRATAETIVERLVAVLDCLSLRPDEPIGTIDVVPAEEQARVRQRASAAPTAAGRIGQERRAPRDDREAALCALFAKHLGESAEQQVGIDDNFFDLGGSSLLAIRLVKAIREELGADISLRTLFDAPTVAQLTERIGGRTGDAFEVLLPLRTGGDGTPVFCVHPLGGLGWLYTALAQHLPGPDLYALQARGISSDEALPATLEEMAADYVREIRRVQPSGPYHLLGWSLGGNVAQAMASLLEDDGAEVALLGILDAYPRTRRRSAREYGEPEFLEGLLRFAGRDPEDYRGRLDRLGVLGVLRESGSVLSELDEDGLGGLYRVMANSFRLSGEPTVARTRGAALVIAATTEPAGDPQSWNEFIEGGLTVIPVSCRHDEILNPGPVNTIGRVLSEYLKKLSGKA